MHDLNNFVYSFDRCTMPTLQSLPKILKKSEVSITFWGQRVVTGPGERSVSLDALATKVHAISRARSEADDLTPKERLAGIAITKSLNTFYQLSDHELKKCNFFTRLLNYIREFHIFPYTVRFHIEETTEANFTGYSKENFIQTFGKISKKKDLHDHPDASGASFGPPLRICAKETSIKALS